MAKPIDKKYLEGLEFRTSEVKEIDKELKRVPVVRPLTPDDVLDWADKGKAVVIVAADGKKHTVAKVAAKE